MFINLVGKPVRSDDALILDHTVVGAMEDWTGQVERMDGVARAGTGEASAPVHNLVSLVPEGSWPFPTSVPPSSRTSLSSGHGNE